MMQDILEKVTCLDNGCVDWTGRVMKTGYPVACCYGRPQLVHRLFYQWFVGPIPSGQELHHLCRNRRCVNVEHLQPVERKAHVHLDNTFAHLNSLKTHCPYGHPYEGDNLISGGRKTGPHRKCRICTLARKHTGIPNHAKTHCPQGHPYEGENVMQEGHKRTHRRCRICRSKRSADRYARLKSQRIS